MERRMRVEIWADVLCPWCGLGSHRLSQAVSRFEHGDKVDVTYRSFQLDPNLATDTILTTRQLLGNKYGLSGPQVEEATRRVEGLAERDGLRPYTVLDNRVANSGLAHEYLAYATTQGRHLEAWRGIFGAYFGEVRPIFTVDDLVPLGEEIGLDPTGTRKALVERRFQDQIIDDAREAAQLGVRGVPFYVLDDRYAVSGAQDTDVLLDALNTAWAAEPTG